MQLSALAIGVGALAGGFVLFLAAAWGLGAAITHGVVAPQRARFWFGFSLLMAALVALSMGNAAFAVPAGLMVLGAGLALAAAFVVKGKLWRTGNRRVLVLWLVTGALVVAAGVWVALGLVTNYDTGLYHLQLIGITAREGVTPGIGLLHDRFGFSSSLWGIGAMFERVVGPDLGFRMVSGLFLVLLVIEMLGRARDGAVRISVGTWLVLAGGSVLMVYGLSYAGRTFAGIGQDWIVALLWLAASAYLADGLQFHRGSDFATAAVIAALAGSVRPFGWLLFVGVLLVWCIRCRGTRVDPALGWWAGITAVLWMTLTAVRDALASGWLFFPAGVLPLPVDWRIADPGPTAEAITLWARSPFDMDMARGSWDWVGPWALRLLTDWMVFGLVLAVISLAAYVILLRKRGERSWFASAGAVVMAVGAVQLIALLVWFVIAPDPRFAWGPILVLLGLVSAWVLPYLKAWDSWPRVVTWLPVGVLAAGMVLAVGRDPGWWLDRSARNHVGAVPVPVAELELSEGIYRTVGPDDRCWQTELPCVPWYAPK